MKLRDKVAIVTGSSRGIGKAVAKLFAREGARVVVTSRSEVERERLPGTIHATVEEIRAAGGEALAIPCDVRHEDSVASMVEKTASAFGGADILVNNAAATYPALGREIPIKRWDIIMDVNLRGYFLCLRAVLPHMLERGAGSILNMTSSAGNMEVREFQGRAPSIAYGASKAAVNKLTLGFAHELKPLGIGVNALMPKTPVATEGAIAFYEGKIDDSYTSPDTMAQASLYLVQQPPEILSGWIGYDEDLREQTAGW